MTGRAAAVMVCRASENENLFIQKCKQKSALEALKYKAVSSLPYSSAPARFMVPLDFTYETQIQR